MNDVSHEYNELDRILCKVGKRGTEYENYEKIESEHHDLLKSVSEYVREMNGSDSASRHSRKSRKSNMSKHSSRSSQSVRADVAATAAALRTKLNFVDAEAQSKAMLETIQIQKGLEIAEAQVEAIIKIEREDFSFDIEDKIPDGSNDYVENYVTSVSEQSISVSNPSNLVFSEKPTVQSNLSNVGLLQKPVSESNQLHTVVSEKHDSLEPSTSETLGAIPKSYILLHCNKKQTLLICMGV